MVPWMLLIVVLLAGLVLFALYGRAVIPFFAGGGA